VRSRAALMLCGWGDQRQPREVPLQTGSAAAEIHVPSRTTRSARSLAHAVRFRSVALRYRGVWRRGRGQWPPKNIRPVRVPTVRLYSGLPGTKLSAWKRNWLGCRPSSIASGMNWVTREQ